MTLEGELVVVAVEAVSVLELVRHGVTRVRRATDVAPHESRLDQPVHLQLEAPIRACQEEAIVPSGGHGILSQAGARIGVGDHVGHHAADLVGALLAQPLLALDRLQLAHLAFQALVPALQAVDALQKVVQGGAGIGLGGGGLGLCHGQTTQTRHPNATEQAAKPCAPGVCDASGLHEVPNSTTSHPLVWQSASIGQPPIRSQKQGAA